MDEKRYLDTRMNDKERLFYDSLSEIAEALGHSFSNPVSVSLLCLALSITNDEKEKLYLAFWKVLRENKRDKLSVSLFRKAIEDVLPMKKFADSVVIAFIKASARNFMAELEPFARSLN